MKRVVLALLAVLCMSGCTRTDLLRLQGQEQRTTHPRP